MDNSRKPNRDCCSTCRLVVLLGMMLIPTLASAQVRTKKPDRLGYQSPSLSPLHVDSRAKPIRAVETTVESESDADVGIAEKIRQRTPRGTGHQRLERIETVYQPQDDSERIPLGVVKPIVVEDPLRFRRVAHEEVILAQPGQLRIAQKQEESGGGDDRKVDPDPGNDSRQQGTPVELPRGGAATNEILSPAPLSQEVMWDEGNIIHDGTCDGCPDCEIGCDSIGCDSMGYCDPPWYRKWSNTSLCFDADRFFGSVELLLMFRRGDRIPPLVTTTVDDQPDPDTAGQLGEAGTRIVVGNDAILKNLELGGRATLGTWLDDHQCQSLVLRGWFAGQKKFGFNANQNQLAVIARPFLNVSDDQDPEQDTQLVAFPDRASGSIEVSANNEVFGGDISLRQYAYGRFGGSIDFLYGYQYMRLNDELGISTTSTSLDDSVAPLGSVLSVADVFRTRNEFHGGQLGLATRYQEGCWSFHGLGKVGFGSLRRRAKLSGLTLTSVDGDTAVTPTGLLVRDTNAGTFTDHTFGWVPELNVALGYRVNARFDLTVGYHIIAMTDALQPSGTIDPQLAVNLSEPPLDDPRPALVLRDRTYYVQGINFGLQCVY